MSSTTSTSRGSKLSRSIQFFREASYDEARVAHILVNEIMAERTRRQGDKEAKTPAPRAVRARKPKVAVAAAKPLDPASDFPASESLASA
jgi:hypothetical protein